MVRIGKLRHRRKTVDRRQLYEAVENLRRHNQELLTLNESKDEFVAIASHQLRTPATAVKQYLGLLLEGYAEPLTESQRLFLEKAYENNERQLRIVDEMLRVAQLDLNKMILKKRRFDIDKLIEEVVAGMRGQLKERRQTVRLNLPDEKVKYVADRERLKMVIENIVDNAVNYSGDGQTIDITLRDKRETIEIAVKDRGVGIKHSDIPLLFRKFSRIQNERSDMVSSTGLGLYFSGKVTEMHGGHITVKSLPKRGSTFTIILPKRTDN